jgi:soluble lytic murein transglycosylase-like protein
MTAKDIKNLYEGLVKNAVDKNYQVVAKYDIDKQVLTNLILSIIYVESKGNASAVGDDGCSLGLMQLNWCAGTPQRFGVSVKEDLFKPAVNINAGTKYLFYLIDKFNGNLISAISGYNAGEKRVGINYASYVMKVLETFNNLSEKKIFLCHQFHP